MAIKSSALLSDPDHALAQLLVGNSARLKADLGNRHQMGRLRGRADHVPNNNAPMGVDLRDASQLPEMPMRRMPSPPTNHRCSRR